MSVRTADAGTPPPERPPESIQASRFAPDTFFAYAATPDWRPADSSGKGPPTDAAFTGHGGAASATETGATVVEVVVAGTGVSCVPSAGAADDGIGT
jgi:hypothetical protein